MHEVADCLDTWERRALWFWQDVTEHVVGLNAQGKREANGYGEGCMSEAVFARIDNELHPLDETPFSVERDIQRLVGAHPELLAGAQMDPGSPRRFVLIAEEIPVPDQAEGVGAVGPGSLVRRPGRGADAGRGQARGQLAVAP